MADKFYSVVLGESVPSQVTTGAGTSGEAIELRVNDAVFANKMLVILGLKGILYYLETKAPTPLG